MARREELVRQLHAGRDALAASLLLQRRARPPTTSLGQLPEADPGALQGQDRVRAHAHGHRPVRVYGVHVEPGLSSALGSGCPLRFPGAGHGDRGAADDGIDDARWMLKKTGRPPRILELSR